MFVVVDCVVRSQIDNLKSQNVDLLHIAEDHRALLVAFQEQLAKLVSPND